MLRLNYLDNQGKTGFKKIETAAEKRVHAFLTW